MDKKSKSALYLSTEALVLMLLPLLLYILGLDFLMILTIEVFVVLCYLCIKNLYSNIFFLGFLLSFFVFLMSGDIASSIFGKYYYIQFDEVTTRHCWTALLISLSFLYIGYLCKIKFTHISVKGLSTEANIEQIKNAAKVVYYLTYGIMLANTIDKVVFVANNGYVAYYSSYNSFLPIIIAKLGDFTPIALCIFLATFPSKKEASVPIRLFLLYAVISLLIGARGGLVYNSVFLFGYMLYRNKHNDENEIWVSKKTILVLVASIPFLLVLLFLYGYVRLGNDVVYESFGSTLVDFFVNIGSSSKIIKYGYEYQDAIEKFKFYSFGDTLNYFKYGRLFNWFSADAIPSTHSAQFALEGHSFEAFLSYHFMKMQYLNGEGGGSSFIAELFADFGYIGIAIGSFIYGMIFKSLSNLNRKSWLSTAVKLYFFLSLIRAPRGSYDGFIAGVVNITFWIVIIGVVLLSKVKKRGE